MTASDRPRFSPLDIGVVARAATSAWIAAGEADSPTEINNGLCADFATAIADDIRDRLSHEVRILGSQDLFEGERFLRQPGPPIAGLAPPPGTDWGMLEAAGARTNLVHSWITCNGLHFDAEAPDGVPNPLNLPCLRHALAELVESYDPKKYGSLVAQDNWWARTRDLRQAREAAMTASTAIPHR